MLQCAILRDLIQRIKECVIVSDLICFIPSLVKLDFQIQLDLWSAFFMTTVNPLGTFVLLWAISSGIGNLDWISGFAPE